MAANARSVPPSIDISYLFNSVIHIQPTLIEENTPTEHENWK